jgi:hypothetical protein
MQYLPADLIAHIGTFLDYKDRRRCLETAKIFGSINYQIKSHLITIDQQNAYGVVERLSQILAYVRRRKPTLQRIMFTFAGVKHITFDSIQRLDIRDVDVVLQMYHCSNQVIVDALSAFENVATHMRAELTIIGVNGTEPWLSNKKVEYLYTVIEDDSVHTIHKMKHIPELYLSCHTRTRPVDLTCIDLSTNKELHINMSHSDLSSYIGLEKASVLSIQKNTHVEPVATVKFPRLKKVIVSSFDNISGDTWRAFIANVPDTTVFCIHPSNPSAVWGICELKIRTKCKYQFRCYSRDEALAAHVCKRMLRDMTIEVLMNHDYAEVPADATALDVYNKMSADFQKWWYMVAIHVDV